MKKIKLSGLLIVGLLLVNLISCSHDNDPIPEPEPPTPPTVIQKTAYEVFESLVNQNLPNETFENVKVSYDYSSSYVESYSYFDPIPNPNEGESYRFYDLTKNSVTLETNGNIINITNAAQDGKDLKVLNPIPTGNPGPTKIELTVSEEIWGLKMIGQYEDGDKTINVSVYFRNIDNNGGYNFSKDSYDSEMEFDSNKQSSIYINVKYVLKKSITNFEESSEITWTPLPSECDYAAKNVKSSPFTFNSPDQESDKLFSSLQFALNTPCIKLAEYGFDTKNPNIVSIASLFRMIWFGPYFSRGIMTSLYPVYANYEYKERRLVKTEDFPGGTFFYFTESNDNITFYVNVAKLLKIRMLRDFMNINPHEDPYAYYYPLEDSKIFDFLGNIAVALGDNAVNGIRTSVKTSEVTEYSNSLSLEIQDSELSRRLTQMLLNMVLEKDNLARINEQWKSNGLTDSEIQTLNSNLTSLKEYDAEYNFGINSESHMSIWEFGTSDAEKVYNLMQGK